MVNGRFVQIALHFNKLLTASHDDTPEECVGNFGERVVVEGYGVFFWMNSEIVI